MYSNITIFTIFMKDEDKNYLRYLRVKIWWKVKM